MTILSLNIWGGRRFEKLLPFINEWAPKVDVFCFQEMIDGGPAQHVASIGVRGNMYQEMLKILSGFQGYTFLHQAPAAFDPEIADSGILWGEAIFVKDAWTVREHGGHFLYDSGLIERDPMSFGTGNMLAVKIECGGKQYTIVGVHGLFQEYRADDPSKRDTVERIEQSRRIVDFVKQQRNPSIVIGDFNLRPETQSIAMLSEHMRDLIAEHGITNTRNYEYELMEKFKDYIADYAFITKDLTLKDFKVLPDVVSDHAPLLVVVE